MPSNYIVNGSGEISFSADGAATKINGTAIEGVIGWVQSGSAPLAGGDKYEGRGANGNIVGTILYNDNGPMQCSILLKVGATLPVRGDIFTVGGKTATVETATVAWSNTDGTKLDISGQWYSGFTPVAGGLTAEG